MGIPIKYPILHKLTQYKFYWLIHNYFRKVSFFFWRVIHGIKSTSTEDFSKLSILKDLTKTSLRQLLFAILTAILLHLLNILIAPYLIAFGLKIPEDSAYTDFFVAIAGIGGIFIALYYAAVSTLASTIYSEVPNNLRYLVSNDRPGKTYINILAYVTFLSLTFLTFHILGFPELYTAVIYMILLSGIGIFSFVILGQRLFGLYNPTILSSSLYYELHKHISNIQPSGFRWLDSSFQNYVHEQALRIIDALDTINDITNEKKHLNGQPYCDFAINTCNFLREYQKAKNKIPTKSLWYRQKYIHRKWYESSLAYLEVATNTSTQISPEAVPDTEWLEQQLIEIIKKCLATNYSQERFSIVIQLLNSIDIYLQSLADDMEISKAYIILDDIFNIFTSDLPADEIKLEKTTEVIERLALFERFIIMCINILLRCTKQFALLSRNNLSKKLSDVNWYSKKDIYLKSFPAFLMPQIEQLHSRLTFEIKVEGSIITPLWYQTEILALAEANTLKDSFTELIIKCADRFPEWIKQCNLKKRYWLCAALQSRELEYWSKVEYNFDQIEQIWKDIVGGKKIKTLTWPKFDISELQKKINTRQESLAEEISRQSALLPLLSRPVNFPDYPGQFLHMTAQRIIQALCTGDEIYFEKLYKTFFVSSISKFDELRLKAKDIDDWRIESFAEMASAPIIDMLQISGYTKIMADYHNNLKFWTDVIQIWDKYLTKDQPVKEKLNFFAICVKLTDSTFRISPRAVIRTSWQQQIERILSANVPRRKEYRKGSLGYLSDDIIEHDSPFVRLFVNDKLGSFYDGIDVFIEEYFHKREDAKDLDFGNRRRHFKESLQREIKSYEKYKKTSEENNGTHNS